MATDHPLPGDLVIREERVSPAPLYVITVHPNPATKSHTYPELTAAVERARQVAATMGGQLQVWREVQGARGGYERIIDR